MKTNASSLASLVPPSLLAMALLSTSAWAAPFTVHADGTVTDDGTGLVWDQCYINQSGAECSAALVGPFVTSNWEDALARATTLNTRGYKGHADWRVPNVKELLSLRDLNTPTSPTIDITVFPNAVNAPFWTSTTDAADASRAWVVNFGAGEGSQRDKLADGSYVRLVRAGPGQAAFDALAALDTSPPVLLTGPVVTPVVGGTTAVAQVSVNEDATGYWLVHPAANPAPAPSTLMVDGAPVPMQGGVLATLNIGGLTPGDHYVLYFIAVDASLNAQPGVTAVPFVATLQDTSPPVLLTGPVVTPAAGGTTAVAQVSVNEAATGYWMVRPAVTPAPLPGPLMADGAPVQMLGGVSATLNIAGLNPGDRYVLYFIAEDASDNAQPSVTAVPFAAGRQDVPPTVTPVPALSAWALSLLAGLLGWFGRRRG